MAIKENLVIGAFQDRNEEYQAIQDLRNAGFTGNSVEVADHSRDSRADMSVSEALKERGIDDEEASFFQRQFDSGCDLVAVRADGRRQEAEQILRRHQAWGYRLSEHAPAERPSNWSDKFRAERTDEQRTMELKEEELRVRKQAVESGEAIIRKEVTTEHKSIDVPVTKEEVVIERRPATGKKTGEPLEPGEEIRVPVMEEEVRVEKQPVVKEEVAIRKEKVQRTERVSGDVRKEELRVEREGDADIEKR